jgi:CubicO group peptidase (beta-lactamase class C family)
MQTISNGKAQVLLFLALLILSASGKLFSQMPDLPPGFDKYMDSVLRTFEVPGISLAVVKDGNIVLTKGYGVVKLGRNNPVDAHTLFPIASNTKAFTTTALAMLVEAGKLKWTDPVIRWLPWFAMSDHWVTAEMTIRDLLVHHSGIPAFGGDLLIFPPSVYSRREIVSKVALLPIVHSFRTTYAYDNILYLAAGEVIKAVSGMEWEDFIQTQIFNKVGMSESIARFTAIKNIANVSAAHLRVNGKVKIADQVFDQAIGDAGDPAGGIASNATDMAKWLLTQLDSGMTVNKTRLLKSSSASALWNIVTPIPIAVAPPELAPAQLNFYGYSMGLRSYNYGRYKVVGHGGKLDGFVSQVAMIPELHLGIAVLTNQESTGAYWSVIYRLLDYYLHNKQFNWLAGYKKQLDSSLASSQRAREQAIIPHNGNNSVSLPIEKYAGTYRDDFYGMVTITADTKGLKLTFNQTPQLTAILSPFQFDSFSMSFNNADLKADGYASFFLKPDGTIDQLKLTVTDPDCDLDLNSLVLKRIK